jgi:hypothetical protein
MRLSTAAIGYSALVLVLGVVGFTSWFLRGNAENPWAYIGEAAIDMPVGHQIRPGDVRFPGLQIMSEETRNQTSYVGEYLVKAKRRKCRIKSGDVVPEPPVPLNMDHATILVRIPEGQDSLLSELEPGRKVSFCSKSENSSPDAHSEKTTDSKKRENGSPEQIEVTCPGPFEVSAVHLASSSADHSFLMLTSDLQPPINADLSSWKMLLLPASNGVGKPSRSELPPSSEAGPRR